MARVVLKNVSKTYDGGVTAVVNMSLEIREGEFLALVGPSGCGKSTALRMIAGLETVSEGMIRIGGKTVNDVPPKDRDIAMVFQNYALYPHMSVYENMAFGLRLRKYGKPDIDSRVREAAAILGIESLLDRRPKQLSGGQRQRVAVGRAIVRKPAVFLFDEPLSNLDARMRVQMRAEISRLHNKLKTTMIYVTHDQAEAMTMGNRIAVMNDGVVQQIDEPVRLYDWPANRFVAGFIGTPPMNFFDGAFAVKNGAVFFAGDSFELPVPDRLGYGLKSRAGEKTVLGLRPENIGSSAAESQSDPPRIRAKVDLVEPTGAETCLHVNAGRDRFISRVDAGMKPAIGKELDLAVQTSNMRFFDVETGRALPTTTDDKAAVRPRSRGEPSDTCEEAENDD